MTETIVLGPPGEGRLFHAILMIPISPQTADDPPKLIRGIGLSSAIALNMTDMIGVGPFITLPLIVGAMGGPQAMLGWIAGAIFAMCDGLIWAELGAAMSGSGGSYHYLAGNLWKKPPGKISLFSLHLATFFQRSALGRLRLDWTRGICLLLLAQSGA